MDFPSALKTAERTLSIKRKGTKAKGNPFVHKQFLKFSTLLNEYDDYFNKLINEIYPTIVSENMINVDKLLKYDDLIIKRLVMRYLYNNYENDIININNDNTELILSLIIYREIKKS